MHRYWKNIPPTAISEEGCSILWHTLQKRPAQSRLRLDVLKYVIFALIAFLVSNAKVMGGLSPFGVALTAAVPLRLSYVSFISGVLGYIVFGSLSESLTYLAAMVFVLAVKLLLRPYKKLRENPILLSLVTGVVSAASGIVASMGLEHTAAAAAVKILEAVLAARHDHVLRIERACSFQRKADPSL